MGANNWTACPKCEENKKIETKELMRQIADSYGNVSEDEYNDLRNKIYAMKPIATDFTLREGYKIGICGEKFEVNYIGTCTECKFSFTYTYSKQIE